MNTEEEDHYTDNNKALKSDVTDVPQSSFIEFKEISNDTLRYIEKQNGLFLSSAIFPLILGIISILNIYLISTQSPLPPIPPIHPIPSLFDRLIPFFLGLLIACIGIIHFIILLLWKKNYRSYHDQSKSSDNVPLTRLIYNIIDYINWARIMFIILNIVVLIYSQWFVRFLMNLLAPNPHIPPPSLFTQIINISSNILLIVYLVIEWIHFLRWNKKLKHLSEFEKHIYQDLNL
ncbi:MAG: hypothetical protein ACTSVU_06695 [Promethearchaeota archaeon]